MKEINKEPENTKREYSSLLEDKTSPVKGVPGEQAADPSGPAVGVTAKAEKEVEQVWRQYSSSAKEVTLKVRDGFGAKAAR